MGTAAFLCLSATAPVGAKFMISGRSSMILRGYFLFYICEIWLAGVALRRAGTPT